jgi:hypothetical protein
MFRVVSRRSRERDSHTARVQKVAMPPFASPIHKPMLFQIRNELSNLPRHIKLASKKQLQSDAKLPKFVAAIARSPASAHEENHGRTQNARQWVKRNQLDGGLRTTDKGSVGKGIDQEEGAANNSPVGPQNPPHAPWKTTIVQRMVQRIVRNTKMLRTFLIGMLFGVMTAAAFTYAFAIPANNFQWRMEIYKRGGAAWTYDKNGHVGWKWMVEPISDTPSHMKRAVAPPSSVKVSSERL